MTREIIPLQYKFTCDMCNQHTIGTDSKPPLDWYTVYTYYTGAEGDKINERIKHYCVRCSQQGYNAYYRAMKGLQG